MDNQILKAALEYAARGWAVMPISKDKTPLIKWQTATKEELTDPDNIRKMFEKFPAANVAIVTGSRSGGLVVIDLDYDELKGKNGKEALKEWCEQHDIFSIESSATVQTGRGGQHLYFQSPFTYHNQVDCLNGVDIRAEGGCVVAPPSIHGETRRQYFWDIETDEVEVPTIDSDVAEFLGAMEAKAQKDDSKKTKKNDFKKITKEGGRNNQLFKYVSKLQGEGEADDDIRKYAEVFNQTHLSPPLDPDEVERTINSVLSHSEWKGGKEEPEGQEGQSSDKPKKEYRKLKAAKALLQKDIPEPTVYVGVGSELPFLVEGTCILSAKPKLGKSWLALALCLAVTSGEDFLGYKVRKCSALYLDLETSESSQKKRVTKMLKGKPCPENFYLDTETSALGNGFIEQIESYLQEDPNIGVVIVDVFQIIRSPSKNFKESEYDHAYRDITPLNALAQKYHISIILVCHDRKSVDPEDPFSNILGSTGLQGAATQMIVMFRGKKNDPIHISVKGKTIDGLPDMDVNFEDAVWSIAEHVNREDSERAELWNEFKDSPIRAAVKAIAKENKYWKGRCSTLIQDAVMLNIPITDSAKFVGGFLHKHVGRFLKSDGIQIRIIENGTGAKIYEITNSTVDTVDENGFVPLIDDENAYNTEVIEKMFL